MSKMLRSLLITGMLFVLSTPLAAQQTSDEQSTETPQSEAIKETPADSSTTDAENAEKSTPQASTPEILAPVDAIEQHKSDLNHFMPSATFSEILVTTQSFTLATNTHETPQNKGTVILLPDWKQALTNHHAINYLKNALPSIGWTTLTLTPPNIPDNFPSNAPEKTKRADENAESLTNYREFLVSLFEQLYQEAKRYPGVIVVLAQGNHALLLPELFNEGTLESPAAFIMLSGYMLINEATESAAQQVAFSDVPILDLYLNRDNYLVANAAKVRKKLTTQELTPGYRQRALHNITPSYYPQEKTLGEIKGWLRSIGW